MVINVSDCEAEEQLLERYPGLHKHLSLTVKPKREVLTGQIHEHRYWRFWDSREELYRAMASLDKVIACPRLASYNQFWRVSPKSTIFSDEIVLVACDLDDLFAILCSTIHATWAQHFGTRRGLAYRYVVSRCFRTFPFPQTLDLKLLTRLCNAYTSLHEKIMERNNSGLASVRKLIDSPAQDPDGLRDAQVELDRGVAELLGLDPKMLDFGFEDSAGFERFWLTESSRIYVLNELASRNILGSKLPSAVQDSLLL